MSQLAPSRGLGSASPWTLPNATSHVLHAADDVWDVHVWRPDGTSPDVPALYVTDPLATFATTVTTLQTLSTATHGRITPTAVVGIAPRAGKAQPAGAEEWDFDTWHAKRLRDLTPDDDGRPEHVDEASFGLGRGPEFLQLILTELAPEIEERYALTAQGRGIAGWSLGGLLTAHAMLTTPEAFDRYLLVSPSLWWNHEALVEQATQLPAGSLVGKHVYIGTGELESDLDRMWPSVPEDVLESAKAAYADIDMCGCARRFAAALAGSGARVHQEVIPDEHHITVWGAAMTRGLVQLYGR